MRRTHLLLLLVALSIAPGLVAADIVGSPDLDIALEDDSAVPGEDTELELTVTNSGDLRDGSNANPQLNDRVTTARGLTVTVDDGEAPVTFDSDTRVVGKFPEGERTLAYAMTVEEDADPGTYTIPVEAEYRYTNIIKEGSDAGEEITLSRDRAFEVTLEIEDDAQLEVVDVTPQARVGSTGTVAVTVENSGTEAASEAALRLESRNAELSFGGTSTASRSLGEWEPGERRTVEYRVRADRSAGPQPYAFDATAEYEDSDGRARTSQTRTIAITPREEQTFAVESVDSTVAVGDTGTVTVEMRNEGPIAVRDASVELASTNPALTFSGSQSASRFAGAWEPGETHTLEYDVTATEDADTRPYVLDATVSYRDQEGDTETAPARTLGVEPDPGQSFDITEVTSTLRVGWEGTIEGRVVNTGQADVSNAVVVFETDKRNVTPLETEVLVGNLAAGESATFSLPVEISESGEAGPKQYSMEVQYRNSDGDLRTSDTIDVNAEVGADERKFGLDVDGATVAPGSGTTLEVTVTNNGDERVTDISANMFADSPISVDDDEAFVGALDPGESETVRFSVGASGSALAKTYPVSVDFQYDEPDGDTKLSQTYRLAVSVQETEDGGTPLVLVGMLALTVVVGGAVLYRRYG